MPLYTDSIGIFAVECGGFMNNRLKMNQKHGLAAVKDNFNSKGSLISLREVLFPLSLVPGKCLQYCAQFWPPQYKKDLGILE